MIPCYIPPEGSPSFDGKGPFDIDIDYILVVGHFGLATGSGGITQSNMHNESCPKPFTPR